MRRRSSGGWKLIVMKSTKHQAPSSREAPSSKSQVAGAASPHGNLGLKVGASLELGAWCLVLLLSLPFLVVAAAEIFFQPNIKADEQVAAAHFLYFEFWSAGAAVAPGNRNDRPGVAAHNRFERQFDGEIKVRSDQGTAAFNDRAAVRLKRIGGVIEFDVE